MEVKDEALPDHYADGRIDFVGLPVRFPVLENTPIPGF
jgi:hypothetical protein